MSRLEELAERAERHAMAQAEEALASHRPVDFHRVSVAAALFTVANELRARAAMEKTNG